MYKGGGGDFRGRVGHSGVKVEISSFSTVIKDKINMLGNLNYFSIFMRFKEIRRQ
jgi:hypothetical protein